MARHALLNEADRLLHVKGRAALDYLKVLLLIKRTPSIWRRRYGTFDEFCTQTGHGPSFHVTLYERIEALLGAYDRGLHTRGKVRSPASLEAIGFDAARQLLKVSDEDIPATVEALYRQARGQGHVLTYQSAVNTIYRTLGLRKMPSKTVRGRRLKDLRANVTQLTQRVMDLHQLVALLRRRVQRQEALIHLLSERMDQEEVDHKDLWPNHPLGDEDIMAEFDEQQTRRYTKQPDVA